MAEMWSPTLVLLAITVFAACASIGGGFYEVLVLDPVWPSRPAIVQPRNGGVSRRRFWILAHGAFEVALLASLAWSLPEAAGSAVAASSQSRTLSGDGRPIGSG